MEYGDEVSSKQPDWHRLILIALSGGLHLHRKSLSNSEWWCRWGGCLVEWVCRNSKFIKQHVAHSVFVLDYLCICSVQELNHLLSNINLCL